MICKTKNLSLYSLLMTAPDGLSAVDGEFSSMVLSL